MASARCMRFMRQARFFKAVERSAPGRISSAAKLNFSAKILLLQAISSDTRLMVPSMPSSASVQITNSAIKSDNDFLNSLDTTLQCGLRKASQDPTVVGSQRCAGFDHADRNHHTQLTFRRHFPVNGSTRLFGEQMYSITATAHHCNSCAMAEAAISSRSMVQCRQVRVMSSSGR